MLPASRQRKNKEVGECQEENWQVMQKQQRPNLPEGYLRAWETWYDHRGSNK